MSSSRKKEAAIGTAVAVAAAGSFATGAQGAVLVNNTHDHGPGSLRRAIEIINSSGPDHIVFKSRLSGEIALQSDLPRLTQPVTITGPGKKRLSVSGQGVNQIFDVVDQATISGLTLKDGFRLSTYLSPDPPCYGRCGGGGYSYGPAGGAINMEDGSSVAVRGVRFLDNYGQFGGAISKGGAGDLLIRSSTFSGNESGTSGGAVYAGGRYSPYPNTSSLTVTGSRFHNNVAHEGGGAIFSTRGIDPAIRRSVFTSNTANGGGALAMYSGNQDTAGQINGSTFAGNHAGYAGGAAALTGHFSVFESSFSGNNAGTAAGGLDLDPSFGYGDGPVDAMSISNSTISGNRTGGSSNYGTAGGGGVRVAGYSDVMKVVMQNVTVANNVSVESNGGGIQVQGSKLLLDSVTVSGNRVSSEDGDFGGGGINQLRGTTTIRNSIVSGNTQGLGDDLENRPGPLSPVDESAGFSAEFSLIGSSGNVPVANPVPGSNRHLLDPELGKLAKNGGPTRTMLPEVDSLAINSGSTRVKFDQRNLRRPVKFKGVPRPAISGANYSDMGAVERQNKPKRKHGHKKRH